jgi:hypothetical protein
MASALDAMALAARGFRVFPIAAGKRQPPLVDTIKKASTDIATIAAWWPAGADHNIGVACGAGVLVVDADEKKGKNGIAEYFAAGGVLETFSVATPSGGMHFYFSNEAVGQAKLSPGVDIRSEGGYVLGPGSRLDGSSGDGIVGEYRICTEAPLARVPFGIGQKLAPYRERTAAPLTHAAMLDDPRNISDALHYLRHRAPVAIEGANGDDTTYKVACAVRRDYGITAETTYKLLLDEWNDRCFPPWEPEDLWQKVENAENYGTRVEGAATSAAAFGHASVPAEPELPKGVFELGNAVRERNIKPRDWIVHRMLLRQAVTALLATGSAGKTTLLLTIAALSAEGRGLSTDLMPSRNLRFMVADAEETREELSRRVIACCATLNLDPERVMQNLVLVGLDDVDMNMASGPMGQWTQNVQLVDAIIESAQRQAIDVLAFSPLNKLSSLDILDNTAMSWFMQLLNRIAVRANCAVMFAHHTSKGAERSGSHGDAHASLGAASIINSTRIAYTMTPLTPEDLISNRIPEDDAHKYVRLDDAKMNLTLKGARPLILRRASHKLMSGDEVGALAPHVFEANDKADIQTLGLAIYQLMGEIEGGKVSKAAIAERWQMLDPHKATVDRKSVMALMTRYTNVGQNRIFYTHPDGTVHEFTSLRLSERNIVYVYADQLAAGVQS